MQKYKKSGNQTRKGVKKINVCVFLGLYDRILALILIGKGEKILTNRGRNRD